MGAVRAIVVAAMVLGLAQHARAQAEIDNNFKYNSGQDVQPIFEGWSHAPDGGFLMHFGYLNRNWAQELAVPVGPGNNVEPGGPDRGQPTFFYTRTNRNQFTVKVPKDFGRKEIVWTVTANGKTQKAIGWLQAEWEIDPVTTNTGAKPNPDLARNQPPTLTLPAVSTATVSSPLTLASQVSDDGLPKPTPPRKAAIGQETPPLLRGGTGDVPQNVPQLASAAAGGGGRGGGQGPTVTWLVWRGPAGATFTPRTASAKDGQTQTTVRFSKPGEYILKARASDRLLTTERELRIIVK